MNPRWPHQQRAFDETVAAIAGGGKRICVTSPTGSGKTRCMIDMLEYANGQRWDVVLYTNRRMLLEQTKDVLESHGIIPGMRAAGHEKALLKPVQLAMTQTEGSQVLAFNARELHPAKLVLIDEAHVQTGAMMLEIIQKHVEAGAAVVGYTATPLDLGATYEELIVAGNMSGCRACGALVAANTYAPDEPDLRHIKQYRIGEDLSDADNRKAIMRPGVFGRVFKHWSELNPNWEPTILFGPDVAGSSYFAKEFTSKGVRAAHIDGESIWLDDNTYASTKEMRDKIMAMSKAGDLPVICNRYVLREGIDAPWIRVGIFACVFGKLSSLLQSGGRLLRAFPGKDKALVIDHGGNSWRHGSLNSDREWSLGQTNQGTVADYIDRQRNKTEPEPICCPRCHAMRLQGPECPKCGFAGDVKSRMVVQINGTLKQIKGDVFKPRKTQSKDNTADLWRQMYFRLKKTKMTFKQAEGLFFKENRYWPPRDLPLMPKESSDWTRKVSAVPMDQLRRDPNYVPKQQREPTYDPQSSMFGE